jgi:hypothetical protein
MTNTTWREGGAAGLLALAAAPTFALMAAASALAPEAPLAGLCSARGSGLTGMVPMYLLMSLFHLGPWLRVLRRNV